MSVTDGDTTSDAEYMCQTPSGPQDGFPKLGLHIPVPTNPTLDRLSFHSAEFRASLAFKLGEVEDLVAAEIERLEDRLNTAAPLLHTSTKGTFVDCPSPPAYDVPAPAPVAAQTLSVKGAWGRMTSFNDAESRDLLPAARRKSRGGFFRKSATIGDTEMNDRMGAFDSDPWANKSNRPSEKLSDQPPEAVKEPRKSDFQAEESLTYARPSMVRISRNSRASRHSQVSGASNTDGSEGEQENMGEAYPVNRAVQRFEQVVNQIRQDHDGMLLMGEPPPPLWRRVRTDPEAQNLVLDGISRLIVFLNCAVISVSEDIHPEWSGWLVINGAFTVIFFLEMGLKMLLSGPRSYFVGEEKWWNLFEAALAISSLVDFLLEVVFRSDQNASVSVLRIVRLVRITRLIRVARLAIFSDLVVMIKGSLGGVKTLFWATILICLPLYGFAIFFRLILGPYYEEGWGAEHFVNVQTSFFTLFRCIVSKECTDHSGRPIFALVSAYHGWGFSFIYCVLDLLMSFGLFNVIVAIFIENVLAKAKTNEQLMKRQRLRDHQFFADKMAALVGEILDVVANMEGGGRKRRSIASREELLEEAANLELTPAVVQAASSRPKVVEILRDLDVADEDTMNLFETLDADGSGTIDLPELFDGIARLRGSATRSDIIAINFMLQKVGMTVSYTFQVAFQGQFPDATSLCGAFLMFKAVSIMAFARWYYIQPALTEGDNTSEKAGPLPSESIEDAQEDQEDDDENVVTFIASEFSGLSDASRRRRPRLRPAVAAVAAAAAAASPQVMGLAV